MSHRIHDMPEDDRPRERLLRLGPGALSDAELLAIFINTGVKGENALQVANRLLREVGSLHNMSRTSASQLAASHALGPAKAAHLAAAFELGRRAERFWVKDTPLDEPEKVYRYLAAEMQSLPHETLRVLLLNSRFHLMRDEVIFTGTVNETMAHPRDILRPAVIHKAYAFTVVHNHPSGDPTPSTADRAFTRKIKDAADVLSIRFCDHVIIGIPEQGGRQPYYSFREMGSL